MSFERDSSPIAPEERDRHRRYTLAKLVCFDGSFEEFVEVERVNGKYDESTMSAFKSASSSAVFAGTKGKQRSVDAPLFCFHEKSRRPLTRHLSWIMSSFDLETQVQRERNADLDDLFTQSTGILTVAAGMDRDSAHGKSIGRELNQAEYSNNYVDAEGALEHQPAQVMHGEGEQTSDPYLKYLSISAANPFLVSSVATHRDGLERRESRLSKIRPTSYGNVYIAGTSGLGEKARILNEASLLNFPDLLHKRAWTVGEHHPAAATEVNPGLLALPEAANKAVKRNTDLYPAPLIARPAGGYRRVPRNNGNQNSAAGPVRVAGNNGSPYKVTVRDPDTAETVVRSPIKNLFGENGLLSGNKQTVAGPSESRGLGNIVSKFKQGVDQIKHALSGADILARNPGPSQVPTKVSLNVTIQAGYYNHLELILGHEVTCFLSREFHAGRLTSTSINTIFTKWENKGRAPVIGFRYDLMTQLELALLNIETLHFSGKGAGDRVELFAILTGWKILAKEFSVRTFCNADSVVKKHLLEAERVLELVRTTNQGMIDFYEIKNEIFVAIYRHERQDDSRMTLNGLERSLNFD